MIPPIRMFGGKSYLAKKMVIYEPKSYRIFGDCCVGGGSYLCVKDRRGVSEFANDLDGELTNFFRVLQDDTLYPRLLGRLEATPFNQAEYEKASEIPLSPEDICLIPDLDRAWRFFVRNRQSRMGMGKDFATRTRRLRRERNENASAWLSAVERLTAFRDRLKWVEIRQTDVLDFIRLIDSPQTFFYIDPPYLPETRTAGQYTVEMTTEQHEALLSRLETIEGKFMLSGYDSPMYREYEHRNGWHRVEFQTTKQSSSRKEKPPATEIIFMNYAQV